MLSAEQINILRENEEYKKTRSFKYNLQYSGDVCSSKNFSISADISLNGTPLQNLNVIISIIMMLFFFIVKKVIISKEIGKYRNAIIERLLNSSVPDDFDICSLISPTYKWVSRTEHKLRQMQSFVTIFLSDSKILVIIYDIIGYSKNDEEKRNIFLTSILKKNESIFTKTLFKLSREKVVSSKHELNKFIENNEDVLMPLQLKNQFLGNLCNVARNKMEENKNG